MQNKGKILVTGGTGYIGSHTVVELLNEGFEVVIADNLENSRLEILDLIKKITGKNIAFEQVDLRDFSALNSLFKNHQDILAVIHFAAYKAVGESVTQPLRYYKNNVFGLVNILENLQEFNIRNIVFSSSCTLYGEPDQLPVSENSPLKKPTSPYGNTKKICEEILEDCTYASNLKCVTLRYFNPVGAHPSALIGELPIGVPNNLFPYLTQTAIGIREKLTIYGDDYDTPDGTCIRDFIHVVDLAKAHVIALNRMLNSKQKNAFEPFNLGTGIGYSVLEVVKTFEKVNKINLNYTIGPRREGDVIKIYSDTALANTELGWKAEEDLESMVSSAWKWQLNIPKLFPQLKF